MLRPLRRASAALLAAGLLAGAVASAGAQQAPEPRFRFPARCEIGADCWYRAYMDLDRGGGYRDHRCGVRSYEGHQGTDIAPADPGRAPIAVLAAAAGAVVGARDGEDDSPMRGEDDSRRGRECGNGVRIDHGGGWTSQYCHLRRGSVTVRRGDRAAAGAVLGTIGSSGWSETPHLHFQVERNGVPVDPFTGAEAAGPPRCDPSGSLAGALWERPGRERFTTYRPTVVYRAGLTTAPPDRARARHEGYPAVADVTAGALVGYVVLLGAAGGTTIDIRIHAPGGERIFAHRAVVERDFAEYFRFAGTPREGGRWAAGEYRAHFVIAAGGIALAEASASLVLR